MSRHGQKTQTAAHPLPSIHWETTSIQYVAAVTQTLARYSKILEIVGDILKVRVPVAASGDRQRVAFDDLALVEDPDGFRSMARAIKLERDVVSLQVFAGTKGLRVTQTFDPEAVDFTWLYAYPDYLGQLDLEVWLKRKRVEPGKRLTFRQTLEIRPVN